MDVKLDKDHRSVMCITKKIDVNKRAARKRAPKTKEKCRKVGGDINLIREEMGIDDVKGVKN